MFVILILFVVVCWALVISVVLAFLYAWKIALALLLAAYLWHRITNVRRARQ